MKVGSQREIASWDAHFAIFEFILDYVRERLLGDLIEDHAIDSAGIPALRVLDRLLAHARLIHRQRG